MLRFSPSLLTTLAPRLAGLVTLEAWQRIAALMTRLPACWSWAGFEVRLASDQPRVDVGLCALRDVAGPALASALSSGELGASWEGVRPLLEEWARPGTLLHRESPTLWLECDMPEMQVQAPFVWFRLRGCDLLGPGLSPAELRAVAESSVRRLPGRHGDAARIALLELAASRLPPGGRIVHFGLPPAWRGTQALRIEALLPSADSLKAWLQTLGWRVSDPQWEGALGLMGRGPLFQVCLALDEAVEPVLALATPSPAMRWPELLGRLVQQGVSDAGKAQAVLDWIGSEVLRLPEVEWLLRIEREIALKLAVDLAGRAKAKAYLAFHPRHSFF